MKKIAIALTAALFAMACSQAPQIQQQPLENSVVYEMNVRQYTPAGTFAAAQQELPRLAEMGVDIVWLMPIHPIGVKERKGTLGSLSLVEIIVDMICVTVIFFMLCGIEKIMFVNCKAKEFFSVFFIARNVICHVKERKHFK